MVGHRNVMMSNDLVLAHDQQRRHRRSLSESCCEDVLVDVKFLSNDSLGDLIPVSNDVTESCLLHPLLRSQQRSVSMSDFANARLKSSSGSSSRTISTQDFREKGSEQSETFPLDATSNVDSSDTPSSSPCIHQEPVDAETGVEDSSIAESSVSGLTFASAPVTCQTTSSTRSLSRREHDPLQVAIQSERYEEARVMVEERPELCRQETVMVCQGEFTRVYPIHVAAAEPLASMDLMDVLVTNYPAALLKGDSIGGRTPLHLALWRSSSKANIRFLIHAQPQALELPDQGGNLPLHAASLYSQPDEILDLLLDKYPQACGRENSKGKLPLHLYCGQCWISSSSSSTTMTMTDTIRMLHRLLEAYPAAVRHQDREGRLPLHIACLDPHPRWDVLSVLIQADPSTLLIKTKGKQTPLQILKHHNHFHHHHRRTMTSTSTTVPDNHVVLSMLQDCTAKERRRQGMRASAGVSTVAKLLPFRRTNKHQQQEAVDLYNCYG